MTKLELNGAIEIIKDRLYFVTLRGTPKNDAQSLYFSMDNDLIYEPFFADFGPLNLGHMYSYCVFLEDKLRDERHQGKRLYHYTSYDAAKRTNAVYLMCCYSLLYLHCTPEEALRPFVGIHPPVLQYRDASVGPSTFGLPIIECLRGLAKAQSAGFFDLKTFNVNEYHFYERIENGDMNWIVPGKFLAFSGPHGAHHNESGIRTLTPEDYIPYFKKHNVCQVVRLNKKLYDKRRFTEYGVKHVDMYFIDGSCPSDNIVQKFLELIENEPGAVAVHCKAGLGRTGTLIGCSLMKHHKFTAYEAVAWLRICRPGSVIGPQQHFLVQMQSSLWRAGEMYRKKLSEGSNPSIPSSYTSITSSTTKEALLKSSIVSNKSSKEISKPAPVSFSVSSSGESVTLGFSTPPPTSHSHTQQQVQQQIQHKSNLTHTSSKERLKADMRAITATLKSIRTSTASFTPSTPTNPAPPPTLYTMSTPTSSTTSSMTASSPYTPQSSSRISALTSTKTKAPSGLALQQKKMENQGRRNAPLSLSSPPSLKQSVPPSRPTLSTVSRTPVTASNSLSFSNSAIVNNRPLIPSSTNATSSPSQPAHRRSRSSGNLYNSSSSSAPQDHTTSPHLSSTPYAPKSQYLSSSPPQYSSSLASPTTSALLRSKTPPPRRFADNYMSSPYTSGYSSINIGHGMDYQKSSPSRYLKT